ncbi:MAG: hypothetical protein IKC59_04090, partial [Clostridia bacterium]|nr:hypothetical protein [Clostridia bacterium]
MPYSLQALSSLEKLFLDDKPTSHPATDRFVMFHNQRLAYQVAIFHDYEEIRRPYLLTPVIEGELAPYTTVREVVQIPSLYPISTLGVDENYLRTAPGFFPDALRPLHYQGRMNVPAGQARSIWLEITLPDDFPAGTYVTKISMIDEKDTLEGEVSVTVRVLDAHLPKQRLIHTEWFYTDCIAEVNHVKPFSEKHWKYVENYLRVAVNNGINMILTPVFTPELDTYIGGERLTTQLVSITVEQKNRYTFDFSQLERWIDLCLGLGVEYFEIPHFFTQWGAHHAPKIIARVGNRKRRIFGWESDALGEEYKCFLSQFIPALMDCLKKKGVDKRCFFHVSDEPHLDVIDHYKACRELLTQHLGEEYPIIDALSDIDFYASGAIQKPIPGIKSITPFLEKKIDGLWAYYCEAGGTRVTTGRHLSMPTARTRILGLQLWLANIEGFLHWGYNF